MSKVKNEWWDSIVISDVESDFDFDQTITIGISEERLGIDIKQKVDNINKDAIVNLSNDDIPF